MTAKRPARRPRAEEDSSLPRLRELCLSLPDTSEVASWGHPNFRTARRTFATFEWVDGRPSIAMKVDPTDVQLLLRRPHFFATPYGRGQWVSVWTDRRVSWTLIERLLRHSHALATERRSPDRHA